MKSLLLLSLIFLFFNCSGKQNEKLESVASPNLNSSLIDANNQEAQFLALFQKLEADSLRLFSQYGPERTHFIGKPIRQEFYKFFIDAYDKESQAYFLEERQELTIDKDAEFSAIYKFPVSEKFEGLIIRTPSDYESTSIKLFIWDVSKRKATGFIELAEIWGDAGDSYEATSQLILTHRLEVIKHTYTSWEDIENPENRTSFDSLFYYQVQKGNINLMKKQKTDSLELAKLGFI